MHFVLIIELLVLHFLAFWFNMALSAVRITGRAQWRRTLLSSSPMRRISTDNLREIYEIEERDYLDERLEEAVRRNAANFNRFRKLRTLHYHSINIEAFETAVKFVDEFYACKGGTPEKRVIIDSGCGQGASSQYLSKLYADIPCIGIDRAQSRLNNGKSFENSSKGDDTTGRGGNLLFVQADLIEFWLMMVEKTDWIVDKHFLLHPNPSPKHKGLHQRFYGKI